MLENGTNCKKKKRKKDWQSGNDPPSHCLLYLLGMGGVLSWYGVSQARCRCIRLTSHQGCLPHKERRVFNVCMGTNVYVGLCALGMIQLSLTFR